MYGYSFPFILVGATKAERESPTLSASMQTSNTRKREKVMVNDKGGWTRGETNKRKKRGESSYLIAIRDILFRSPRYSTAHHQQDSPSFFHPILRFTFFFFPSLYIRLVQFFFLYRKRPVEPCSIIVIRYTYAWIDRMVLSVEALYQRNQIVRERARGFTERRREKIQEEATSGVLHSIGTITAAWYWSLMGVRSFRAVKAERDIYRATLKEKARCTDRHTVHTEKERENWREREKDRDWRTQYQGTLWTSEMELQN